jgi:beta-phosphoglucomutase-like phosphatase (HAD superfamily)
MSELKPDVMGSMLADLAFSAMIFDCDGTLVDTAAVHLMAFREALEPYGLVMDEQWYLDRVGLPGLTLLDQYEAELAKTPIEKVAIVETHNRIYKQNLSLIREIPRIGSFAPAWKGKISMCVASGGNRGNVQASLETTGLRDLFDQILTIDDVKRGKPAPDLFLFAAQRMNVPPDMCVVFEDSYEGLEGARRAGMRGIDVRSLR